MDIKHLQHLDYSSENIEKLISYIEDGKVQKFNSLKEKEKYDRQYGDFVVKKGVLIYEPKNLVVIPPKARNEVIENLYEQDISLGKWKNNWYRLITSSFLGITKREAIDFLKSKEIYQLT